MKEGRMSTSVRAKTGTAQQLRNFYHKVKHKIGCYPKYLLILTAYQVQGWWNMILSSVKYQPDGNNVTKIILKISFKTHLKHSNPYMFISKKVKKPPDGFFTHLFFALATILLFGVFSLNMLPKIIKVKPNYLRLPITDFTRQ